MFGFILQELYVENVKDNTNIVESLFYFATELENGLDYTFGVTAVYDGPIGGEDYESEIRVSSKMIQEFNTEWVGILVTLTIYPFLILFTIEMIGRIFQRIHSLN